MTSIRPLLLANPREGKTKENIPLVQEFSSPFSKRKIHLSPGQSRSLFPFHCCNVLPSRPLLNEPFLGGVFFFFKIFLKTYFFREKGREGEREGEKHQLVASHMPPTGDLACNPGKCPDWELTPWPFGLWASAQSPDAHWPQQPFLVLMGNIVLLQWSRVLEKFWRFASGLEAKT